MIDNYKILLNNVPKTPYLIGHDSAFKSAVLVPFIKKENRYYVLFEKRAKGIRQAGEICFPGGVHDFGKDSDFADTALRETKEELGISQDIIKIDHHLGYLAANMGASINIFTGRLLIKDLSELCPDKKEVESIYLVPFDFFINNNPEEYKLKIEIKSSYTNDKKETEVLFPAKELGLPKRYHGSWEGRIQKTYVYRYKDIIIWGITAKIIMEIAEIIKRNK